ncbi:hypothetical protein AVEN_251525-1 [Araneus ventricosus]|uniref:Uncharacterized protein n=1 Tax=Araneus ventricosus TaxID=182803 RepID=A0A4Y2NYU2_ARAVE|nr:hypothetical protein AVEN_251525-1 [Araneus ventricosus]
MEHRSYRVIHRVAFHCERQKRVKSKRVEHELVLTSDVVFYLPKKHISYARWPDRWRTGGVRGGLGNGSPRGLLDRYLLPRVVSEPLRTSMPTPGFEPGASGLDASALATRPSCLGDMLRRQVQAGIRGDYLFMLDAFRFLLFSASQSGCDPMFHGNYCSSGWILSPLLVCKNNLDSPCIVLF